MAASRRAVGVLFTLAWRNLWRNYRRTTIMLVAIVVGVWAMILFSALISGMVDEMVRGGLRTLPGEVQVHHLNYRDDPSVNNSIEAPAGALLGRLEQPPVTGWASRVRVPAMISSERDSRAIQLLGVDPAAEISLGFDPADIVQGRFLRGPDDTGLVIGRKLAEQLKTGLGKRVVIMSQDPDNNVADRGIRVVGIYRARLQATEELNVYVGRETVQALLQLGTRVSEIAITGDNFRAVDRWWRDIAEAAGPQLETLPWMELDGYLESMMDLQTSYNLIIMVVIFLALSFGLVNTLVMAVFERVREIGLMMALGMRPAWIMYQVLLESLILLALGLVLGNLLALATILPLEEGIDISGVAAGLEMAGMGTTLYPVLELEHMLMSTAVVMVLGLLASLIPAWRASRYNPIQALARN
ncbi:FtsX-like permease family protein [Seongchinamella sediminis]|uniref:FtsX-like permease family protein n=1 Tax=Seongchinamella sediminis TaxID=2283635 RepID=A0A3L7DYS1_9GAMM|nr:FtsX-like permease family protein [Seongchinamella sediminis]RLQ21012.1 FtsX-like permease family protein [Seongchinamella sediminis]